MKLFKTIDIGVVKSCQSYFCRVSYGPNERSVLMRSMVRVVEHLYTTVLVWFALTFLHCNVLFSFPSYLLIVS